MITALNTALKLKSPEDFGKYLKQAKQPYLKELLKRFRADLKKLLQSGRRILEKNKEKLGLENKIRQLEQKVRGPSFQMLSLGGP